jgi:hypothetical protein
VERTAASALAQFQSLLQKVDFVAEGHTAFAGTLTAITGAGHRVEDCMFFAWYLLDKEEAEPSEALSPDF